MSVDPGPEKEKAKRPMTLSEAGRRGGEKVKRERGRDYYAQIGRKGGASVKERRGPAFYAEIGRKGGEARRKDAPHAPHAPHTPETRGEAQERAAEDGPARRPDARPDLSDATGTR